MLIPLEKNRLENLSLVSLESCMVRDFNSKRTIYTIKKKNESKRCSAKLFYFTLWGTMHIYYFVAVMFLLKNRRSSLVPSAPEEGKQKGVIIRYHHD